MQEKKGKIMKRLAFEWKRFSKFYSSPILASWKSYLDPYLCDLILIRASETRYGCGSMLS
jgi:hypothetical protein